MARKDKHLRIALAVLVLIGGAIHLQQFLNGFSSIPVIGPMFLANALASVAVAILLVWSDHVLWVIAGAAIAAGSLGALLISRGPGLFGYVSTTFGVAEAIAVISEVIALIVAAALLPNRHHPSPAQGVSR